MKKSIVGVQSSVEIHYPVEKGLGCTSAATTAHHWQMGSTLDWLACLCLRGWAFLFCILIKGVYKQEVIGGLSGTCCWSTDCPSVWPLPHAPQEAHTYIENGATSFLILDGHGCHISIEYLLYTVQNNIIALSLPSHCSYLLQLFAVGLSATLQCHYSAALDKLTVHGLTSTIRGELYKYASPARDFWYLIAVAEQIIPGFSWNRTNLPTLYTLCCVHSWSVVDLFWTVETILKSHDDISLGPLWTLLWPTSHPLPRHSAALEGLERRIWVS